MVKEDKIIRVLDVDDVLMGGLDLIWSSKHPADITVGLSIDMTLRKSMYQIGGHMVDVFIVYYNRVIAKPLLIEFYHKDFEDVPSLKPYEYIMYQSLPFSLRIHLRERWKYERNIKMSTKTNSKN